MKKVSTLLRRRVARVLPLRLRLLTDAARGMTPRMDGPDELAPEVVDVATGRLLDRRRSTGRRGPGRR